MTTLDTALAFPIRLVESEPSGGAILAARSRGCAEVLSFDMGSGLNHLVERGSALLALLPELSILRLVFFRIGERINPFQLNNLDISYSCYHQTRS